MKLGRGERWIVVMLFVLATVNSMDRLVLASVAPILQIKLHLSNQQYSYIVFCFMVGMTLGQIPVGALIDRIGAYLGLPLILCGWSISTLLHGLANTVVQFSGLRFLMGVCESGNYSGGLKLIGEILPVEQRATGLGFFNSGFLLGSVVAPPTVAFLIVHYGWRSAFLLPGLIGMLWVIPWMKFRRLAVVEQAALEVTTPEASLTLGRLLRLRETWGVVLARALAGPVSQFYWYWLPLYLVRERGASMIQMGRLAGLAYVIGACGNVIGGYLSGTLIHRGFTAGRSRKIIFVFGAIVCSVCTAMTPLISTTFGADLLVGVAIFGLSHMSCMLLAMMSDVFPQNSLARVGGLTGAGEGVVSMVLTLCTGVILDHFAFRYVFFGASILPGASAVALLLLMRPNRQQRLPLLVVPTT